MLSFSSLSIFTSTFKTSTENTSDETRYVLLIRFWHPEVTAVERAAFQFIFEYLDVSAEGEEAIEKFEMQQLLMGKEINKSNANANANADVFGQISGMGGSKGGGGVAVNSSSKDEGKSLSRAERRREEKAQSKEKSIGFGKKR